MTEADWLAGTDPIAMTEFVSPAVGARRCRLLAVGCLRLLWGRMSPAEHRAAKVAERYADGDATLSELNFARAACGTYTASAHAARWTTGPSRELREAMSTVLTFTGVAGAEVPAQVELVRDVFGKPFRPLAKFPKEWKSSTVLALSRGIYADRAFDRMPILADALQDAGCSDERVVSHCLDPARRHVRGCWVLDLLLGKK